MPRAGRSRALLTPSQASGSTGRSGAGWAASAAHSSSTHARRPIFSSSSTSLALSAKRCWTSAAAYTTCEGLSGRSDQSSFCREGGSTTPRYVSSRMSSPSARPPRKRPAIAVSKTESNARP